MFYIECVGCKQLFEPCCARLTVCDLRDDFREILEYEFEHIGCVHYDIDYDNKTFIERKKIEFKPIKYVKHYNEFACWKDCNHVSN